MCFRGMIFYRVAAVGLLSNDLLVLRGEAAMSVLRLMLDSFVVG